MTRAVLAICAFLAITFASSEIEYLNRAFAEMKENYNEQYGKLASAHHTVKRFPSLHQSAFEDLLGTTFSKRQTPAPPGPSSGPTSTPTSGPSSGPTSTTAASTPASTTAASTPASTTAASTPGSTTAAPSQGTTASARCYQAYLNLVGTINGTSCSSFGQAINGLSSNVSDTTFAANVGTVCTSTCISDLRAAFIAVATACNTNIDSELQAFIDIIVFTRVLCFQDQGKYCLPQVRTTLETLSALPTNAPVTNAILDSVCTTCFAKFVVLSAIASGNANQAATVQDLTGLGLMCLKDKLADGTPVYCAIEAQNLGIALGNSDSPANINAALAVACRTRCLAKYFYFAQVNAGAGKVTAGLETLVVFEFICTKNPATNQFCLGSLVLPPSNTTCSTLTTGVCDSDCKSFLNSAIAASGCCFTTNLKFFLVVSGHADVLDLATQLIPTLCSVTLPTACPTAALDVVTFSVVLTNLKSTTYTSNSATYQDAVLVDVCTTLGCAKTDVVFVSATVTNAGSENETVTFTWKWYTQGGVLATSTYSTDIVNTPLQQTNSQTPPSGYNSITDPIAISSGSSSVQPAPTTAAPHSSAISFAPLVAIVLALVAFVLSL